jgi:hypothetical protein
MIFSGDKATRILRIPTVGTLTGIVITIRKFRRKISKLKMRMSMSELRR